MKKMECPNCGGVRQGKEIIYFDESGEPCACDYCIDDYYDGKFHEWLKDQPSDTVDEIMYDHEKEVVSDYWRGVL